MLFSVCKYSTFMLVYYNPNIYYVRVSVKMYGDVHFQTRFRNFRPLTSNHASAKLIELLTADRQPSIRMPTARMAGTKITRSLSLFIAPRSVWKYTQVVVENLLA